MLFVGIAENCEGVFLVYSIPGALSLGGFAAIYQYLKGANRSRIALFAFLGVIGGGILGYAYTEMMVDLYVELVPNEEAVAQFMGAVCMSLVAAPVCALIGGFGKKNYG